MRKFFPFLILTGILFANTIPMSGNSSTALPGKAIITTGEYVAVIEGYDWGPAVSKVILSLEGPVISVKKEEYSVKVEKTSDCGPIPEDRAKGERTVVSAYVSDKNGLFAESGSYVTLVMTVAPNLPLGSPLFNFRSETCSGTKWINYNITVTNKTNGNVWNKESGKIKPLVDKFDLSGSFTQGDITMSYASFVPKTKNPKSPLIIWLHGGGEGGTDPSIPLLANRAANYASDDIQFYFEGAYVLVPQCPKAWMYVKEGVTTHGEVNDKFNEALMALIKKYVSSNPGIDTKRIYVGGCSNGGYMSLKLILLYPDYFAAGYISSLAQQIESIKKVPIWFVQTADDKTTLPDSTTIPVYKRLLAAGASNVHFSFYKYAADITGFYGGENYHYNGHWSWVYLHANNCKYDYDGSSVKLDGRPVTIMEWLAAQKK
jgi:poly(3-hydroxybutyrate) depolymerase